MLDDQHPLSDDDIDDILDAMCSFGGAVTKAVSQPLPLADRGASAVSRETIGQCTVLRPASWQR
jgi:hypothetical protein